MPESEIVQDTILTASKLGARMFRNNTGMGWVGKTIRITKEIKLNLKPGDVVVRQGRPLHAGLCEGSSDSIGITPILITPEMVGRTVGIFTAFECKTEKGKTSELQNNFIQMVLNYGGIAGVVRSKEDLSGVFAEFIITTIKQFFGTDASVNNKL